MAGLLPDSTPGIRPAQWLELLQKQQADSNFTVQLQLLTDEQLLSSSKGRVRRALNQPSTSTDERKRMMQRKMAGFHHTDSASDVASDSANSNDTMDEDGVASTNAATVITKASELSHIDPLDTDLSGDGRSNGRSDINSVVGLSDTESNQGAMGKAKKSKKGGSSRLTSRALDALNATHKTEPYNEVKRKLRKHLDKRRTGRVTGTTDNETEGLPSCFHVGGLYDPRMGSVEVKREGKHAGRWTIWCATCNEGKIPACPECGDSLMHSEGKVGGKKKLRLMQCVACGVDVKQESITTDPHPSCPGHHSHIKIPQDMWLVSPLQWDDVLAMLRGSCWWCHRWRGSTYEIKRQVASLRLLNARLWTPGVEEVMDQKFALERWDTPSEDRPVEKKGFKKFPAEQAAEAGEALMKWVYEYIEKAETSIPESERPGHGLMFAKRREVVNALWRTITSVQSSAPCRHCGLHNPKRIAELKKSAFFYDMSGKDMDANIEAASRKSGVLPHNSSKQWEQLAAELKTFKSETEINKGGGQVVHFKQDGKFGKSKPLREAAPRGNVYLPPHSLKDKIVGLFLAEQESLGEIFYQVCSSPDTVDPHLRVPPHQYWKAFLHQVVEIGPNKFRPFREGDSKVQADDQTKQISSILACCKDLKVIGKKLGTQKLKNQFDDTTQVERKLSDVVAFWKARPRTFEFCARAAQDSYRRIMFAQSDGMGSKPTKGAQQIFEKKSGLFRTNLMGKRVNQACRSVISPDNALEDDQVMLSRRFAKRLTIPEVLPALSGIVQLEEKLEEFPELADQIAAMRDRRGFLLHSILNGATVYPGASRIEMDCDNVERIAEAFQILLQARKPNWMKNKTLTSENMQVIDIVRMGGEQALETVLWIESVLEKAKSRAEWGGVRFKVFRHVATDDHVVLNRQPTLHKSSWLGQRLVVASSERTIRFHYANCKGFNADFDGDEMNIHVPQTERAQMELRVLNTARKHFISSTSGKPLRGLIQDHVVAGVLLTSRDCFLSGHEFDRLVYATLHKFADKFDTPMPTRPEPAMRVKRTTQPDKSKPPVSTWVESWTGKQVISVILRFITKRFSVIGRFCGGVSFEGRTALPATVWNPNGTNPDKFLEDDQVEVVFDEYVRGVLDKNQLGATGGTLVQFVHEVHGEEAAGTLTCCFGRLLTEYLKYYGFTLGIGDLQLTKEKEAERTERLRQLDDSIVGMQTEGDRLSTMMKRTGELNKDMFPRGMAKQYPDNCLAMMTMSGAKGSGVNSTQMAVLLGQQTFDGDRVECMPSGKTLPGTLLGDDRASCGGFGLGRFLSGIRPQQYVVHAAAGRDGLIDTAVKTSRSGYLQRSVVKGMEGLATKWMLTSDAEGKPEVNPAVIDEAGGIVQFKFGHDGLDPQRSAGWSSGQEPYPVALHTTQAVMEGMGRCTRTWKSLPNEEIQREMDIITSSRKRPGELLESANKKKVKFLNANGTSTSLKAGTHLTLLPSPKRKEDDAKHRQYQQVALDDGTKGFVKKVSTGVHPTPKVGQAIGMSSALRKMQAKMACDEPVGIIAAQSVGEPSTQMTLNTFHQAGQTVSHVTEGIPRLRQILQSASVSEPMVLLPVEKIDPTVAKALLKMHVLLSPKKLSDLLHTPLPFSYTQIGLGPNEKYKKIKFRINFSEAKLLNYYVGEHGLSGCDADPAAILKKGPAGKNTWDNLDSNYRKVREALGIVKMPTSAPIPSASDTQVKSLFALDDKKISGAVGDMHSTLKQLNKSIMARVRRSWNWDLVHDASGFDCRESTAVGEKNPLVDELDREYYPTGTTASALKEARGKKEKRPEHIRDYVNADGRTCDIRLLNFDDITGCLEQKTDALSLPSTTMYIPYEGGRLPDAAPADKIVEGEPEPDTNGEATKTAEAGGAGGEATTEAKQKVLNSLGLHVSPHGVCRSDDSSDVLQYHLTLTVPNHVNLVCSF